MDKIIDLSKSNNAVIAPLTLTSPLSAYRIMVTKGPFWKNDGKDHIGIQLIGD